MSFNFLWKQLRPDLFYCQDEWVRRQAAEGSWRISQALCDQEVRFMLSLFFNQKELEWWRCADLQEPKQLSVFEPTFLKLSHSAMHVFQFSSYNIRGDMLKWRHQPLLMKIPSCTFLLFTETLCWGRKERTEFSILYHAMAWLDSLNIIYIHGFLPSAVLENCCLVFKATKVNDANGKLLFERLHCESLKISRTAPIKISTKIKEEIKYSIHTFQSGKVWRYEF